MSAGKTVEQKRNVKNSVKRVSFVAISILLELLLILGIALRFNLYAEWIAIGTRILAALLVLGIVSRHESASLKIPWIILIMAMPVLGVALYLLIGLNGSTRKMRKCYEEVDRILLPMLDRTEAADEKITKGHPAAAGLVDYLKTHASYPAYSKTAILYYPEASEGFAAQIKDIEQAEKFVFMEYHAIEDAESFHKLEEVLVRKAGEGVEVRLFYDDMGSVGFINMDFIRRMEIKGIACKVFNPILPGLNFFLNNRDHRKITVIDGKIGYTGGYNIANEYFNITHPYGYWKDTGIRLEGDAVDSLTVMFLEMWNASEKVRPDLSRSESYLLSETYDKDSDCIVQPYADSPMNEERIGENVYAKIATGAMQYAYFVTPYLIISDEMIYLLGLAAKSGVDVRIITPGIPDKKLIYSVTRSYYNSLARNGVRIYEYTPGFCHCKMAVADDRIATCGTINLDYRSLYHHFENGCVLYDGQSVLQIREDFDRMFAQSEEVTEKYNTGRNRFLRISQLVLRLFSPLL